MDFPQLDFRSTRRPREMLQIYIRSSNLVFNVESAPIKVVREKIQSQKMVATCFLKYEALFPWATVREKGPKENESSSTNIMLRFTLVFEQMSI